MQSLQKYTKGSNILNLLINTNIIEKLIRKMKSGSEIPNNEFSIIFGLKINNDAAIIATSFL